MVQLLSTGAIIMKPHIHHIGKLLRVSAKTIRHDLSSLLGKRTGNRRGTHSLQAFNDNDSSSTYSGDSSADFDDNDSSSTYYGGDNGECDDIELSGVASNDSESESESESEECEMDHTDIENHRVDMVRKHPPIFVEGEAFYNDELISLGLYDHLVRWVGKEKVGSDRNAKQIVDRSASFLAYVAREYDVETNVTTVLRQVLDNQNVISQYCDYLAGRSYMPSKYYC